MSYPYDSPARERWDRERFERAGRGPSERDYYRYEERDQLDRGRAQVLLDERLERRGPRGRVEERERYIEEDRYDRPPRRATFLDEPVPAELSGRALAPYRRPRPQFIRRQSSLDTFDRRPMPRFGDEYRMPPDVPIPLPIRRPSPPPRERFYEDYEARYRGPEDEYRDIRVREERKGDHHSQSRMRSRSVVRRRDSSSSSSSSTSSFEKVKKSSIVGRKGRTRMPKRLAHRSAVIELGYPFEEEENFIIIYRALEKRHIDEIVEVSKKYRENESITYKYEGLTLGSPKEEVEVREVKREEIKREEIHANGSKTFEKIERIETEKEEEPEPVGELVRRTTTTTTTLDPPDHHHHHQDLAVVIPRYRDEDTTRREIRALEAERHALRLERESVVESERDWEIIERERRPRDVIRVERNRKGRMALIRSAH